MHTKWKPKSSSVPSTKGRAFLFFFTNLDEKLVVKFPKSENKHKSEKEKEKFNHTEEESYIATSFFFFFG